MYEYGFQKGTFLGKQLILMVYNNIVNHFIILVSEMLNKNEINHYIKYR